MANKDIDIAWVPKKKGDKGQNRDRDKYRNNYDKIFKKCESAEEWVSLPAPKELAELKEARDERKRDRN